MAPDGTAHEEHRKDEHERQHEESDPRQHREAEHCYREQVTARRWSFQRTNADADREQEGVGGGLGGQVAVVASVRRRRSPRRRATRTPAERAGARASTPTAAEHMTAAFSAFASS